MGVKTVSAIFRSPSFTAAVAELQEGEGLMELEFEGTICNFHFQPEVLSLHICVLWHWVSLGKCN